MTSLGAQAGRTNPHRFNLDGQTNPYSQSEAKELRDPRFDLVAHNLARYRWYGPIPGRAEELDLIRRAQNDDPAALATLVRYCSRTVLKLAGKYYGPTRDDVVGWGQLGLLEAIRRFDFSYRKGLRAYARPWIRKFMAAATQGKSLDPKSGELSGRETHADRVLHSHPGLIGNPAQLAAMAKCSLAKAEQAIAVFKAVHYPEYYATTEGNSDDGDGTKGWDYGSDQPSKRQNPTPAERHPMTAMYDPFDRHHRNPQFRHHEILGPGRVPGQNGRPKYAPAKLKPGMIEVAAEAAERLAEWALKECHRPCFAGWHGLVGKTDRKKISRREYALQLVDHDLQRSKVYADERLYRYPEQQTAEG